MEIFNLKHTDDGFILTTCLNEELALKFNTIEEAEDAKYKLNKFSENLSNLVLDLSLELYKNNDKILKFKGVAR